jgi:hypothetical protein
MGVALQTSDHVCADATRRNRLPNDAEIFYLMPETCVAQLRPDMHLDGGAWDGADA